MPRLFIAIDLPERIRDDIAETYCAMRGVRWTDENQLHCTLRFIGEASHDSIDSIISALRRVESPPLTLNLKGAGYFPPRRDPTVLWIGVAENDGLTRLQSRIERTLVSAGIPPDGRKFHPHITIARLNGTPPEHAAEFVVRNSLFRSEDFSAGEFHLYESIMGKTGAQHTIIASFGLTGTCGMQSGGLRFPPMQPETTAPRKK